MKNKYPVQYTVNCINPEAHLFEITCSIQKPNPAGQRVSLPNWIPGSYMIRDFSRNITEISVKNNNALLTINKVNKNTWQCEPSDTPIIITYTVYAFDLSVRSAHLDTSHAFFNGTSLFLMVHGFENKYCSVDILKPKNKKYKDWKVATTLTNDSSKVYGFGVYKANNYDELIDHPVEIGEFSIIKFKPKGIEHELVITGRYLTNEKLLAEQLTKICNTHIELFGEFPNIQRYLFLTTV